MALSNANTGSLITARTAPKRPYLDSSVFVAYIKKEPLVADNGHTRWEIAYNVLRAAEASRFKVYTSTVTIAEVRRLKERNQTLDANELSLVQGLFQHSYIEPIEVSRDIAEKAQELAGC